MHDLVHRCASAGRESLPATDSGEDNRDGCSAGCHAERCAGAKAAAATVSSARVAARDFIGLCDRGTPDAKPSADCMHATRRTVAVHRTAHQVTQVSSKTESSSRTQRRVATTMALAWVWEAGGRAQRMAQPGDRERDRARKDAQGCRIHAQPLARKSRMHAPAESSVGHAARRRAPEALIPSGGRGEE